MGARHTEKRIRVESYAATGSGPGGPAYGAMALPAADIPSPRSGLKGKRIACTT